MTTMRERAENILYDVHPASFEQDIKMIESALLEVRNEALEEARHIIVHTKCEDAPSGTRACCWALDQACESIRVLKETP